MTTPDVNRLRKIVGMFGSAHEGERATALNLANQELARLGKTWPEIIVGESAAPQLRRQPPASPRTPLVPAGTRCRLRIQIIRGKDDVLHASRDRKSRAKYLLLAFTVTAPERHAGAQFRDRFGMYNRAGQAAGYYAKEGRAHVRRMALCAGVRLEKPGDLDGIEIEALVGIRQRSFKDADGESENHITTVLLPGREGGAS